MASIQTIRKGDVIIERRNGKDVMIPVRKVEFNACSTRGVHVNTNMCYDFNAVVHVVEGEATLGDLKQALEVETEIEYDADREWALDREEGLLV